MAHIWFLKSVPSAHRRHLLDMTLRDLERVLYFESNWVVIEPGLTTLKPNELLNEEQVSRYREEFGDGFKAASAPRPCATCSRSSISPPVERELRGEMKETRLRGRSARSIVKRLKVVEAFQEFGQQARVDDPGGDPGHSAGAASRWFRWTVAASRPRT